MHVARTMRGSPDKALNRAIVGVLLVLAIGVPLLGVIYFLDQYHDPGPSLVEREVATAEQAVTQDSNNIGLRLVLATAYVAAHRPDDAIRQYDEILKVSPAHRGALLGKGDVLVSKGDLGGAKASYQKLVDAAGSGEFAMADDQLEAAYYGLGSIALQENRAKDAVSSLESALKINGTDSDAWNLLGTAQLTAGNAEKSVAALRNAITFVPTGWTQPYTTLARAYASLGRSEEASFATAMASFNDKRVDEARQALTGLTSGPAASDAMFGLGLIAEASGETQAAADWFRKVVSLDPGNAAAKAGLARATSAGSSDAVPTDAPVASSAGGNG